ncbi:YLP motif-containing protein 1 [Bactrocera oleae]|uniref:YLP motif-containing protein 1 n=1 Tax=Bactrocera oleae TaxID=104688 RepID=UPI00387E8B5A
MNMQLMILLLLWRCLLCFGESTITHATNVSKRQLQYGGNYPPPSYQAHGNQQANYLLQTPPLLYDPGYNAQHLHEIGAETDHTTDAAELSTPNATQPLQQRTPTNHGLGAQFEAPQTFSQIYLPHGYATGAQLTLSRTAPHTFPGETTVALAARNSGRSYSTSSTYFVPMSLLYHPNVDSQLQPSIYAQRLAQQPQQMQAYNPLSPPPPLPPALYQQYALQAALPPTQPTATPSIAAQSTQLSQQQQQPAQQQTISQQQTSLEPHALPPLPRLPHLLPPSTPPSSSPLPLNFQAPFHPSQFLGYMHERDARNSVASSTGSTDARTSHHTKAYTGYPQPQVEKPIYEHMASGAKQQNYPAAVARYGRYIYMAPNSGYALFKAT